MITFHQLFFETSEDEDDVDHVPSPSAAPLKQYEFLVNVPDALNSLKIEVIEPIDVPMDTIKIIAKRRFLQKKYDALHAKKNLGSKHKQSFFRSHMNKCVVKRL